MLGEPWNTLLFLILLPGLLQIYKVWRAKGGKALSRTAKQGLALVLAVIFTVVSGGFIGLEWPALPVWQGDLALFIGAIITFGQGLIAVVGGAWVTISGLYEVVLKRIYETFGGVLATPEAATLRAKIGFFG